MQFAFSSKQDPKTMTAKMASKMSHKLNSRTWQPCGTMKVHSKGSLALSLSLLKREKTLLQKGEGKRERKVPQISQMRLLPFFLPSKNLFILIPLDMGEGGRVEEEVEGGSSSSTLPPPLFPYFGPSLFFLGGRGGKEV